MFAAKNPFEDIVQKATSEELTSENWELNLEICDRISTEGETSARNCVAAIQKRLVHRNANVQLYALTLADALSKNCGLTVHQELASRSFTQTLARISLDRNTHPTVKKRCVGLVKQWATEFQDESLGIMRETFDSLKSQNVEFDEPEAATNEPSSEQLRAEDEELRRALELSVKDQGGRANWVSSYPGESSGQGSSSAAPSSSRLDEPKVEKALPVPAPETPVQQSSSSFSGATAAVSQPHQAVSRAPETAGQAAPAPVATRVRALYDFSPTEPGELAFAKGDVIRVLDSVYEHWWRGEVRGEAGIFPVNYVEVLPDPTPAELQREAEMEARIFSQAANIDRLLSKLRSLDPARDNLAEDEELQELYQTSLAMRPKIVKLIDRYSTKITELKTMNDKFVHARGTFDEMMEQSLARYNPGDQSRQDYLRPRPEFVQQNSSSSHPHEASGATWSQGWTAAQSYAGPQPGASPAPQAGQQDAYSQWYYAQQQQPQQHQPHQAQQQVYPPQGLAPGAPQASASSSSLAGQTQPQPAAGPSSAAASYHPQPSEPYGQPPQDDEKRRLYERARAESEAFQRAHFAGSAPPPSQQYAGSSTYPQQQPPAGDHSGALSHGMSGMNLGAPSSQYAPQSPPVQH